MEANPPDRYIVPLSGLVIYLPNASDRVQEQLHRYKNSGLLTLPFFPAGTRACGSEVEAGMCWGLAPLPGGCPGAAGCV